MKDSKYTLHDIQPALKHAAIVFLLHSADLFCVQKRNGTFGDKMSSRLVSVSL